MSLMDSIKATLRTVPAMLGGTVTVLRLTSGHGGARTYAAAASIVGRLADRAIRERVDPSGMIVKAETAQVRVPDTVPLKVGDLIDADGDRWAVVGRAANGSGAVRVYLVEREGPLSANPRTEGV